MTLIIALANMDWSILVSDRRGTVDGRIVDSDLNKTASLTFANAELMYAFAGLAKAGDFETKRWIESSIIACSPPDFDAANTLMRVAELATDTFRQHASLFLLGRREKLLTILFSGYLNSDRPIAFAEISNREEINPCVATNCFRCRFLQYPSAGYSGSIVTLGAGAKTAMRPSDWDRLMMIAEPRRPARASLFQTVKLMREIAQRRSAGGAIGQDMMSIMIHRGQPPMAMFHSASQRNSVFSLGMLWQRRQ